MTCLLKEMRRASSGDEPRYEAVAWGEQKDGPALAEVNYIDYEDCETEWTKVIDPRLADCQRCLWFYELTLGKVDRRSNR